jgi:hypothetical protein
MAFSKLRQECQLRGTLYFKIFEMYLKEKLSSRKIAERLGKSEENIKYHIHIARSKIKDYMKREIASYSSSQQEYEEELEYLSRFLGRFNHAS